MARLGFAKHRKFRRLVALLRIPEAHARGLCELLWESAYEAADERIGDATDVESSAKWTGKAGKLCEALLGCGNGSVGLIEEVPGSPGVYRLHDFWHHCPDYVRKRRKRELERQSAIDDTLPHGGHRPDSDQTVTGQSPVTDSLPSPCPAPPCPALPSPTPQAPPTPSGPEPESSPRASARGPDRPEPRTRSRATAGLTEQQRDRLDALRRRIQGQHPRDADAVDRVILKHLREGAPFDALEQGLVSLLEHRPEQPPAYLDRILRVEAPNHHERAAIAQARGGTPSHVDAKGILAQLAARTPQGGNL